MVGSFEGSRIEVNNFIGMNSLLNSIIAFLQSHSIQLERVVDVVDVVDVVHDKGNGNDDDDDDELEESIGSINSITRNADFISLY
jgi:hypothetical protein